MKIQVLQENVKGVIERLARIAPQKSTLPVLQNIKIETRAGDIYFSATDLEIGATIRVSGKVQDEGAITLPASLLKEFISNLKNGVITIETDDTYRAHVSSGKSEATIAGIEVDEFPMLPAIDGDALVGIDGNNFKLAIDRVVFAAKSEKDALSQPILAGVHMRVSDTVVTLEAADGYRMSQYFIDLFEPSEYGDFIIPAKTMREMALMIGADDVVEVAPANNGNRLAFRFGATQIVTRIIEGSYPEIARLVPTQCVARLIVETGEMNRNVKLSNPFDDESQAVYLDFDGTDTLTISTRKIERGNFNGTIEGLFEGEKSRVALNSRFLGEALQYSKAERVSLEMNGEKGAFVIRETGNDAWLNLITPMTVR